MSYICARATTRCVMQARVILSLLCLWLAPCGAASLDLRASCPNCTNATAANYTALWRALADEYPLSLGPIDAVVHSAHDDGARWRVRVWGNATAEGLALVRRAAGVAHVHNPSACLQVESATYVTPRIMEVRVHDTCAEHARTCEAGHALGSDMAMCDNNTSCSLLPGALCVPHQRCENRTEAFNGTGACESCEKKNTYRLGEADQGCSAAHKDDWAWLRDAVHQGDALAIVRKDAAEWELIVALERGETPATAQRVWAAKSTGRGVLVRAMYADRFVSSRHARVVLLLIPPHAAYAVADALRRDVNATLPDVTASNVLSTVQCFFVVLFLFCIFCASRFENHPRVDKQRTQFSTRQGGIGWPGPNSLLEPGNVYIPLQMFPK